MEDDKVLVGRVECVGGEGRGGGVISESWTRERGCDWR